MPVNDIEEVQRKVFDILALNIMIIHLNSRSKKSPVKKLTFSLIKEALETDSSSLRKILSEAINLPKINKMNLPKYLKKHL
jgi:hypothetical protein